MLKKNVKISLHTEVKNLLIEDGRVCGVELNDGKKVPADAVIPIPFFPEKMQKVLELLPFASMQNVALRIYSGSMTGAQMQKTILIQIFWLVALVLMGSSLCRFAEKKVMVQGG